MTDQLLKTLEFAYDWLLDDRIRGETSAIRKEVEEVIEILVDDLYYDNEVEWSDTFPQEEGLYWFFGQDYGQKHSIYPHQIRLHTVKVWRVQNGYSYVCDGHFIYPSEAIGVWLPITLPGFPKR